MEYMRETVRRSGAEAGRLLQDVYAQAINSQLNRGAVSSESRIGQKSVLVILLNGPYCEDGILTD
jgi:hypothetical protein